jgi:hypothetical protein
MPVGYSNFAYQDPGHQTPEEALRCCLRFLAESLPRVLIAIQAPHKSLTARSEGVAQQDREKLITELARSSKRTFLIFDTIDECKSVDLRKGILQVIARLRKLPQVRILVTSRPHLSQIETVLQYATRLEVKAATRTFVRKFNKCLRRKVYCRHTTSSQASCLLFYHRGHWGCESTEV